MLLLELYLHVFPSEGCKITRQSCSISLSFLYLITDQNITSIWHSDGNTVYYGWHWGNCHLPLEIIHVKFMKNVIHFCSVKNKGEWWKMTLNLEPCASGSNANPALVLWTQWLLPFWVVICHVLPCWASQHTKFVSIIRLISLKWLNWWGIEAHSKGHKFHPVSTLNSEEARGLCSFCPSLPTLGVSELLLLGSLLFQHTHRLHWAAHNLKGAGADVCLRRGTASNFRGLWLRSSVKVCVLQQDWKSVCSSQRGTSLNARPDQDHKHLVYHVFLYGAKSSSNFNWNNICEWNILIICLISIG